MRFVAVSNLPHTHTVRLDERMATDHGDILAQGSRELDGVLHASFGKKTEDVNRRFVAENVRLIFCS